MTPLLLICCWVAADNGTDPLDAALAKPVTQGVVAQPLPAALAALSREQAVAILFDGPAFAGARVRPADVKLTIGKAATLAAALDESLRPHKLTWFARYGAILVTTEEAARSQYLEARVYRLTRSVPPQRRVNAITSIVAPETWTNVGGPGEAMALPPNKIVVRQSPTVHRQILAKFGSTLEVVRPPALDAKAVNKVERKLAGTATFDFDNIPLTAAAARLARGTDLPIRVDLAALKDAGIADEVRVSLRIAAPHALGDGLGLLVEQTDPRLAWVADEEGVSITTRKAAKAKLIRRTYAVGDVLPEGGLETLILAIHDCIEPRSWDDLGGDATIKPSDKEGAIEVSHDGPTQRQIAQLLAALRAARK